MNAQNAIKQNVVLIRQFIPVIISINVFIGTLAINFVEAIKIIYKDVLVGRLYKDNLLENLRKIVWACLPIATLTVSASSIVYSIHVAPEFAKRGLNVYLGGVVALALIREGVPVMSSLALITQFCTGMTAQIGSMKITEQLDAMKISNVNPIAYILVPMLLSGLIGFPIVAMVCILVSLVINFVFSNLFINITHSLYLSSIFNAIAYKDFFLALVKTSVFGFVVTLISYTCGILTIGGSKAVGRAIRLSVMLNFALVIILDYIITALWL